MEVTGWTYYGNEKFVDILDSLTELKTEATKNFKSISMADVQGKTEDEVSAMFEKRYSDIKTALDTKEILEFTDLADCVEKTVIEDIRKNRYVFDGNTHQNADYGCPIIDNKYLYSTTQRSWGQLMSEAYWDKDFIIGREVLDNNLRYIYYAWSMPENECQKIPDESLWVE